VRSVRTVFIAYLVLVLVGIGYAIALGLMHR
jgi:hypothetical protein